jgi:protein-S-isoprenylcysteine O-methyltransferase Ste14
LTIKKVGKYFLFNIMYIKLLITIVFSVLYAFFELYMSMRQRNRRTVEKTEDKFSVWIIVCSISAGYWLSFFAASTRTGRIYHWDTLFVIGSVLVIIGLIIRVTSIFTLKKQFTYTVTKVEDHQLIEKGLYRFIRHPGYLGQLIIFLGISVTLSNWLSVLLMIIPVLSGYIYRIIVEEKFMAQQLGQIYLDYQNRTKRLIPGIY